MPIISIIIPNYNRASLITKTIDCLLNQSFQDSEIIVVDDGSTDNSVEVIKSYGNKIRLICQQNRGPGAARNRGLEVATGKYIQFFDSDDLCSYNKLQQQVETLEHTNGDIAYSPWSKFYFEERMLKPQNNVIQQKGLPNNLNPMDWFLRGWTIVFQACMFRHSFIKRIGFYRTDLMPTEDSEFLFRMLTEQPKIEFVSDCLTIYRLHTSNQISGNALKSTYRIKDWHNYYSLILTKIEDNKELFDIKSIQMFKSKALSNFKLAQSLGIELTNDCDFYEVESSTVLKELSYFSSSLYNRGKQGISRRIARKYYPKSYQEGKLNPHQIQLIQELGFTLKS